MKRLFLIIMSVVLLASCGEGQKIKVAVFQGDGGAATCIRETVAALSLDEDMEVRIVHSSDIAAGVLDSLDAIVIPGGGGSRQYRRHLRRSLSVLQYSGLHLHGPDRCPRHRPRA